jgi:hypothetical protein
MVVSFGVGIVREAIIYILGGGCTSFGGSQKIRVSSDGRIRRGAHARSLCWGWCPGFRGPTTLRVRREGEGGTPRADFNLQEEGWSD